MCCQSHLQRGTGEAIWLGGLHPKSLRDKYTFRKSLIANLNSALYIVLFQFSDLYVEGVRTKDLPKV